MHPKDKQRKVFEALMQASDPAGVREFFKRLPDALDTDFMPSYRTPLMYAAEENMTEMAELLLSLGAKPDVTDCCDRTALMFAASAGSVGVTQALLAVGAKVDMKDSMKATALAQAVTWDKWDVAGLLIEHRADAEDVLKGKFVTLDMEAQIAKTKEMVRHMECRLKEAFVKAVSIMPHSGTTQVIKTLPRIRIKARAQ